MKKLFLLIIVIALCITGSFYYYKNKKINSNIITLYGNVDIRQVNLAFRTGGRVESLKVEEGEVIKKGDLLATIDNKPILNKLNQAKAQLEIARVQMKNANIYFNRNKELCRKNAISKQQCDDIRLKKEQADSNFKYAKAVVDDIKTTPIYTLSLNNEMWAKVYIKETQLGKVKIGSSAEIYTDSTDKVYKGHIGFISPVAEFTPKNIETTSLRTDLVYKVKIVIDDADDYLKQGMPITVKIK